ncbi:OsmC family protein [Uliginosibacterium sp. sgz301328]|uniref:OsmC family protein n=1 Tax=Uliginosibacterium sp. sgz301328 TaxID=3243764 RepID=UPI00359D74D9
MIHVRKAEDGKVRQQIDADGHTLFADTAAGNGGDGSAPDPHALLDAALGACTALTVTLVAQRRQIPLQDVRVSISHKEGDGVYTMDRRIELVGDRSEEQREFLLGIANRCPIHRTLTGHIEIDTQLV